MTPRMKPNPAARRPSPPRRGGLAVVVAGSAGILLLAAGLLWLLSAQMHQEGQSAGSIGGPFTLTGDDGRTVTGRSFPGKFLAIYFGYTSCPDICPQTLGSLTGALGQLGQKAGRVQPIFITIDPQRDQVAILHRYVGAFGGGLVGLTGTAAQLQAVARSFHVEAAIRRDPDHPDTYTVDHSSVIYLMAPDGAFVAPIPADAGEPTMAALIARSLD